MREIWLLLGLLAAPEGAGPEVCAGCHLAAVADHRASRHRVAWSNAIFSAEYGDHPKAWCVTCHAPEVEPIDRIAPPAALAEVGVTCASCHRSRRAGADIRARRRRPGSIHATEIDPELGGARDCGACHQFNFPVLDDRGRLLRYTGEPMQNTAVEAGGADCTGCHGDHRFAGSHRPELVRSALSIALCRDGEAVELRLTNRGAAHNIPSGGVNRYMTATLWRSSAPERLVELRLGRRFARAGPAKRTVQDSTISAGDTAVLRAAMATLGGRPGESLNAEVRYIYMEGPERRLADGTASQALIHRERVAPASLGFCDARHSR